VFGYVLERDPDNSTVLSNLADVQSQLGNQLEAAALRSRLVQIDPHPPYYFFNLGMAAMQDNDFRTAKTQFAREVARADYNHEFHFWLAVAYFKLGESSARNASCCWRSKGAPRATGAICMRPSSAGFNRTTARGVTSGR